MNWSGKSGDVRISCPYRGRQAGVSDARPSGDELPCLWLVLTAAVNSGLAISYVFAWRDQGFRAVKPSCKPGPDFEACRRDKLIGGAGVLIWAVAAFAITEFACWFALSGRLNLAMVTLDQKIRSMCKSGKNDCFATTPSNPWGPCRSQAARKGVTQNVEIRFMSFLEGLK